MAIKLLYITNGINGAGGLERVLSVKASYLADQYGYEIAILSLNGGHVNPFYNFSSKIQHFSINVSGNAISYLNAYRTGLKEIVNQFGPDVISVCDDGLKAYFIPLIIGNKIPIVYERHVSKEIEMEEDFGFFKKKWTYFKWILMEALAKKFAKYVVLTDGNRKEWKSLQNLVVISNPLSFHLEEAAPLKNKVVISVGRHAYQKGQDLLINAWVDVIKKYPDWRLEIYGKVDLSMNLAKQVEALNIEKSVQFFNPEKDIQSKYLASSIYVMSSRFEGFGMVLIEAMACGVPCVSFNCNYGPSDIIKNEVDGFLVENGNVKLLAEKIVHLISDLDLRQKMGRKAIVNVQRYQPKEIVKQWDSLFRGLINQFAHVGSSI